MAASGAPLSIIIIGVGGADFSTMQMLDGDDEKLCDQRGKVKQSCTTSPVCSRADFFFFSFSFMHRQLTLCVRPFTLPNAVRPVQPAAAGGP